MHSTLARHGWEKIPHNFFEPSGTVTRMFMHKNFNNQHVNVIKYTTGATEWNHHVKDKGTVAKGSDAASLHTYLSSLQPTKEDVMAITCSKPAWDGRRYISVTSEGKILAFNRAKKVWEEDDPAAKVTDKMPDEPAVAPDGYEWDTATGELKPKDDTSTTMVPPPPEVAPTVGEEDDDGKDKDSKDDKDGDDKDDKDEAVAESAVAAVAAGQDPKKIAESLLSGQSITK